MSENDIKEINNTKQLLNSIFISDSSENAELCPLINDKTKIPNLLSFLKNKENSIKEKVEIIKILYNFFTKNNSLIYLFIGNNKLNAINLYEPLIELYLSEEILDENKEIIEKMIKLISTKVTMTKGPILYLCQKLSKYLKYIKNEKEKLELINENKIIKYLDLFKIFYLEDNNQNNQNEIINKEIKNYIYFNGKGSGITLNLNKNSINPNTDYPTLQYGISFIMWIYIDIDLLTKYKELNKDCEITLIKIDINGNQIKLILHSIYTFLVYFNDIKVTTLQVNLIKTNDWNNIIFSTYMQNSSNIPIKLFVNSGGINSNLTPPDNFNIFGKITSIKFLENFIGKVSSIMLLTKGIENKEANYFSNKLKYGFYKNKILFNFIASNEKNYFSNCKNYKYYEKFNSNNSLCLYNFHLSKQNIKNLFGLFCPFAYNKNNNTIDDIFGNFIGILGKNDGANYYINNTKNIKQIGGINNLIPIIELMHSSLYNNLNYITDSILTQETFYSYLNLIKNILIDHSLNLIDAIESKFFSSLIIFMQRFPSELFDDKIMEILIEIGKETIKYGDNINSKKENFIDMFLLNEKIVINLDIKKRMNLWQNLYYFFLSDHTFIKEFFNLKKICLLLRIFDGERYNKLCCKRHYEIFNIENNDNILKPEMSERIKDLFLIIQIYINKFCDEEESIILFKLLSLDISSCLQEKIIEIYLNYFSDEKIDIENKMKGLDNLVKYNFIEILEYVFSITLFDIKLKILSIFKIIFGNNDFSQIFKKHLNNDEKLMNNFYLFISENLLSDQIIIKSDENDIISNNIVFDDEEFSQISNYFDKTIYEKNSFNILTFLFEWALYNIPPNSDKKIQKNYNLHIFIIDFLITFVSKCPFNYVDILLLTLSSYFNDQSILNREILFLNKTLYPWLIETIFYFHNSEINFHEIKKEQITSIQKNSLVLFKDFFIHRRPSEEFNKRLSYILRYSIHLRKKNGNINNKKIKEITRITRLLLEIIMEISSVHINYKTKYCFDFIIYHKNNLTGIKKPIFGNDIKYDDNDEPRKSTRNNFTNVINKLGLNTDLILEEDEESFKEKSNDDFNKINMSSISSSFNLDEPNIEKNENENSDSNSLSNLSNIIPDYIFDGLHLKDLKSDIKDNKDKTLKIYWEDFSLYDGIIDYYSSNVWGTENLRKIVGIEIDDYQSKNFYENIIREYGDNKLYKNILLKEILKCLTIKPAGNANRNPKIKINILYINAILLSVALVLTKGMDENIFWEKKFYEFYLFCVLVSINISSKEEFFEIIQDSLYNTLGFASLFFKKWDKKKYKKLIDSLIIPILIKEESKKSTIFKLNKEPNIAISRLFELRQKTNNIYSVDISSITDLINNDFSIIENTNINNFKVFFKGEYIEILKNLFSDELDKVNEERKISVSFKSNYKNENNKLYFSRNKNNEEKSRIIFIIQNVLASYESDIYNYSNEKYFEEKKRRIKYKKNKSNILKKKKGE